MNPFEEFDTVLGQCRKCEGILAQKFVDQRSSEERIEPRPIVVAIRQKPIMLIGQAPGLTEYETGKPFQGPAGQEIRNIFAECGVSAERFAHLVHTSAVVKCFPGSKKVADRRKPGFRREDEKPPVAMINNCRPLLERQVVLADPKIILEKIAWLRKTWPFDDFDHLEPVPRNKRIAQRTGKPLLQAVRFGYGRDLDPGRIFAPKDLRSAYAAIAFDLYAPDETTEVAYYAKILGHAETDIVTALSYLDFRTTLRTKRKATSLAAQSEKALLADLIARKNGASTPELADRIQEDIDTIAAVLARSKARRA